MQATVTFLLTEQAQRAAMAATGQPVARQQTALIEVMPEDLPLCDVAADGSLSVDTAHAHEPALIAAGWRKANPPEATSFVRSGVTSIATPDVLADIRRGQAVLATAYADACATASQYVLDTPALSMEKPENSYRVDVPHAALPKSAILDTHPQIEKKWNGYAIVSSDLSTEAQGVLRERYAAELRDIRERQKSTVDFFFASTGDRHTRPAYKGVDLAWAGVIIPQTSPDYARFYAEIIRRLDADAAAKATRDAEVEQSKKAFIDSWIAEHAEPEVREQYTDGLLCRKAAIALIADATFAALPGAASYNDNFCDSSECPCGSKDLDCLPRKVYPTWKAMAANLPKGYAVEFLRVRECLKEDMEERGYIEPHTETATLPIYLAKITIPHGPFRFERTVKL